MGFNIEHFKMDAPEDELEAILNIAAIHKGLYRLIRCDAGYRTQASLEQEVDNLGRQIDWLKENVMKGLLT